MTKRSRVRFPARWSELDGLRQWSPGVGVINVGLADRLFEIGKKKKFVRDNKCSARESAACLSYFFITFSSNVTSIVAWFSRRGQYRILFEQISLLAVVKLTDRYTYRYTWEALSQCFLTLTNVYLPRYLVLPQLCGGELTWIFFLSKIQSRRKIFWSQN